MAYEVTAASPALAVEASADWKLVNTEKYTNICCYCAGGCGSLCSVRDGELINLEDDPDHPILVTKAVPTDLAVEMARAARLTLICQARPDSLKVFSDPRP